MTPAKKLATIVLDSLEHPHRLFNGDMERLARLVLRKPPRSPAAGLKGPTRAVDKAKRKRWLDAEAAEIRAQVMFRWGYSCELGEHPSRAVEPHHLLSGSSKRHDERPSNVIRACRACHERYHRDAKSFVPMVVRWCAKHGYPLPNRKIFRGDVSRMVWLAGRRIAQHPEARHA